MKKTANRSSVQAVVRRFHWRCQDCRLDGYLDIAMPLSLRHVYELLEDAHETARGKHTCPSDYFEIADVTTQNAHALPDERSEDRQKRVVGSSESKVGEG